jgi:hypothetical protein
MKRLLFAVAFLLFFSTAAFSDGGIEFDLGYSSPNKGLLGARVSPMPWSFGLLLGSFASYSDFALAFSYHFTNRVGFYAFQSHHYLNSIVGNVWEINTGAGYQYIWRKGFLTYIELGNPLYIGGNRVFRHYKDGIPSNRLKNGDLALVEFRVGFGIGYWFDF